MTANAGTPRATSTLDPTLSLYHLLDPEVLANPYPLYHRLRSEDPVHWDAFLHAWVVTRAEVMVRQMLFLDPPDHSRIRGLASKAFTPRRVAALQSHIQEIVDNLLDAVQPHGHMDVIADLAYPLPAIVTAEMLGVPPSDRDQLKAWSEDFAEVLGNFQHNPDRAPRVVRSVQEMYTYFRDAIRAPRTQHRDDLISAFVAAEHDGDRLTEEE